MSEEQTPRILIRKMYEIHIAIRYERDAENNRIPAVQKMLISWEQEITLIREKVKAAALMEVER